MTFSCDLCYLNGVVNGVNWMLTFYDVVWEMWCSVFIAKCL